MTDEQLQQLLRNAVPSGDEGRPTRDLWPHVAARFEQHPRWSYLDLGLAAAAAVALAAFPQWLWLLAYHL